MTSGDDRRHALAADLLRAKGRISYLDHDAVTSAAEMLSAQLFDALDGATSAWWFRPIPRGGLIVAGYLSYILDLTPDQLPPSPPEGRPTVIVDDVALTGARLVEAIDQTDAPEVFVALLAAHPQLCEQLAAMPRVRGCAAAISLTAVVDDMDPDEAEAYRRTWDERTGGKRLWTGGANAVAFPWAEPDHLLPTEEGLEEGWHLISPRDCLKNAAILGPPPRHADRRYRFPHDISFARFDDRVLVMRTEAQQVYELDGLAAEMWGCLGRLGRLDDVIDHLSGRYDVEMDALRSDVISTAVQLSEAGLLDDSEG